MQSERYKPDLLRMIAYCSRCQYGARAAVEITTHIKNGPPLKPVPREADETGDNASESVHRNREKVSWRCFVPWARRENCDTLLRRE
jgi:hypothetical protein